MEAAPRTTVVAGKAEVVDVLRGTRQRVVLVDEHERRRPLIDERREARSVHRPHYARDRPRLTTSRATHHCVQHIHIAAGGTPNETRGFVLERVRLPLPGQAQAPRVECPRGERPLEEQPPRRRRRARTPPDPHKSLSELDRAASTPPPPTSRCSPRGRRRARRARRRSTKRSRRSSGCWPPRSPWRRRGSGASTRAGRPAPERPRQGVVLATEQPGDAVEHEPRRALASSSHRRRRGRRGAPARGSRAVGGARDAGRRHTERPRHDARQRQAEGRVRPELGSPRLLRRRPARRAPRAAPGQRDVAVVDAVFDAAASSGCSA